MAQGPDPNRHFETDREITRDEVKAGGGLGDLRSSRLGLPSWAIALLALLILLIFIALMR